MFVCWEVIQSRKGKEIFITLVFVFQSYYFLFFRRFFLSSLTAQDKLLGKIFILPASKVRQKKTIWWKYGENFSQKISRKFLICHTIFFYRLTYYFLLSTRGQIFRHKNSNKNSLALDSADYRSNNLNIEALK